MIEQHTPAMLTLHLTNGDAAAAGLARSGLPGDILSWRDVLHDGPVLPEPDLDVFRRARAEFLASRGWLPEPAALLDLTERDERLAGVTATDEIVLWFEPNLCDQLQLVQVVARLARRPPSQRPLLTIAPVDHFLGPLVPEKFAPIFALRRAMQEEDLDHATGAWSAFSSPTPEAVTDVVHRLDREVRARTYAADDSVRVPHLAAALRRQLEEYPDIDHGLSRTERQICEVLEPGVITLEKLFVASQATESWAWLSDWSFAWYLQRLSDCSHPLIVHPNGSRILAPQRDASGRGFWERAAQLTPFGAEVLRGREDVIAANGIDRFMGGVRNTSGRCWRWDARLQQVMVRG